MEEKLIKTILIRLDERTHKKMRHISIDTGISINTYVLNALQDIIKKYEKENKNVK